MLGFSYVIVISLHFLLLLLITDNLFSQSEEKVKLNATNITTDSAILSWKIPEDQLDHLGAIRV